MLDTISSNEFPLFGTMSSSSCAMEGIVIQRPLPTESYSWSDLSIILQGDVSPTLSHAIGLSPSQDSIATSTATSPSFGYDSATFSKQQHHLVNDDDSMELSLSQSTSTLSSSTSSSPSTSSNSSSSSSSSSSISKKNVRFAPSPKVRTYSLVLGDHPLCNDGLAIELGWEYCDDNDTEHENNKAQTNGNNNFVDRSVSCQKRSYLSRKQLLLDVAGCTKEELDQRSQELEAQKALIERNRSYRDDYYYCLAFAKRR